MAGVRFADQTPLFMALSLEALLANDVAFRRLVPNTREQPRADNLLLHLPHVREPLTAMQRLLTHALKKLQELYNCLYLKFL